MSGPGFLKGVTLGMGLMYFFDPDRGRRRRALLRDQLNGTINHLADFVDASSRDLQNRMRGCLAEFESMFESDHAGDDVIAERVRSAIGRCSSHPRAIQVHVENGRVTLHGPVLSSEVQTVFDAARHVRGVRSVVNELDVHETAGDEPALQGEGRHPTRAGVPGVRSPASRLVCGAAGCTTALYGLLARKPLASLVGTASTLLALTSPPQRPGRPRGARTSREPARF